MKVVPKGWIRHPMLLAALVVAPLVLAACGGDDPTPTPRVVEKEVIKEVEVDRDKITVKFADSGGGATSLSLLSGVAAYVIENGYGYPVNLISMTTPAMMATIPTGETHVIMETWEQNIPEWHDENEANGKMTHIGEIYESAPQFFVIPMWVHEEYGIDTVDDMKANWQLFEHPESTSQGAFYNCIIGWQCSEINQVKMEAYGLTDKFDVISLGSAAALKLALADGQMQNEPVFGYYWAPTDLFGAYDWWILEEPGYTAACWEKVIAATLDKGLRPIDAACAYDTVPINIHAWSGLQEAAPDVVEFLSNMHAGLKLLSETLAWTDVNGVKDLTGEAAVYYIRQNLDRVKSWITDADALARFERMLAADPRPVTGS